MLRPRDPDIQEINRPIETEADLNNRLLQTTSSKELLAIMRGIREKQAAKSEVPNKSRRHQNVKVKKLINLTVPS